MTAKSEHETLQKQYRDISERYYKCLVNKTVNEERKIALGNMKELLDQESKYAKG